MPKPTITLHLGINKTGSTSLEHFCTQQSQWLHDHNWAFFNKSGRGGLSHWPHKADTTSLIPSDAAVSGFINLSDPDGGGVGFLSQNASLIIFLKIEDSRCPI